MRRSAIVVVLRYAWAAPATLIGLALSLVALGVGATPRVVGGTLEVAGGDVAHFVSRLPRSLRFGAITFGHVIIGATHEVLACCRRHEHVHVRQYERWGAFFFVLYAGSSLLQLARGRDPYLDNCFEREAYAEAPADR